MLTKKILKKMIASTLTAGVLLSSSYVLAATEEQPESSQSPESVTILGENQENEVTFSSLNDQNPANFDKDETPADIIKEAVQEGLCPIGSLDSGFGAYECAKNLNAIQPQEGETKEEQLANAISENNFLAEFLTDEERDTLAASGLLAGAGYLSFADGWVSTPSLALTIEDLLSQRLDAGMSFGAAVKEVAAVKGQEVARLKDIILKSNEIYEYMPDSLMQAVTNTRLDVARIKDLLNGSGVSSRYTAQVAKDISQNMALVLRDDVDCWKFLQAETRVMASEYEAVQQLAAARSSANSPADLERLRLTAQTAGGFTGIKAGIQYALASEVGGALLAVGVAGACAGAAVTRGVGMYMDYAEDKKKFIDDQMEAIEEGDESD